MGIEEQIADELFPHENHESAQGWHYLSKLKTLVDESINTIDFLDLGAGEGASKNLVTRVLGSKRVQWTGVDVCDSAEHLGRSKNAPPVDVYDGITLPYADKSFDVVWCKQVLEHVRYPDAVVSEVARVLRPNGLFIGSVSQLEPYHSRSIFNWTHYGIRVVFADHGLRTIELLPGVDGLLLMLRALFGYDTGLNKLFSSETPFNQMIDAVFNVDDVATHGRFSAILRQKMKIAGHIHFHARKEKF